MRYIWNQLDGHGVEINYDRSSDSSSLFTDLRGRTTFNIRNAAHQPSAGDVEDLDQFRPTEDDIRRAADAAAQAQAAIGAMHGLSMLETRPDTPNTPNDASGPDDDSKGLA